MTTTITALNATAQSLLGLTMTRTQQLAERIVLSTAKSGILRLQWIESWHQQMKNRPSGQQQDLKGENYE
jgi:hypothetical protein